MEVMITTLADQAPPVLTVEAIVAVLRRLRPVASSEADLQEHIDEAFAAAFPGAYSREHRLGPQNRPDFFFPALGLVAEVKAGRSGGNATHVWRQIARYAEHGDVRFILFVTPSMRTAQVLPAEIAGVPISVVLLNTGF
jgi:hypothetical protein